MQAGAGEPGADGGFRQLKDPSCGLDAKPFSDGVQDQGYLGGRCFETVERGVPPGGELLVAGLAVEILNAVVAPMVALANQGVDGGVADLVIVAIGIRAGLAIGIDRLPATSSALALGVRHDGSGGGGQRGRLCISALRTVVWRSGPQGPWAAAGVLRWSRAVVAMRPSDPQAQQQERQKENQRAVKG
jgi:hypothetical protein